MTTTVNNFSRYTFVTEDGVLVCYNAAGKTVQPKGKGFNLVNDCGNKVMVATPVIVAALKANNGLNRFGEEPDYSVKMNRTMAAYIRHRVSDCKVTITQLANAFNVDHETIAMIVKNITYKDPAYFTPIKYAKPTKHRPDLLPACI